MKPFIFSKRFIITFVLVLVLHLGYLAWGLWRLYKDDLTGKGLPASLKIEWVLTTVGGSTLILSFLLAFLAAITFTSHYSRKRTGNKAGYFSLKNIILTGLIGIGVFLYTSFAEPRITQLNRSLLMDIVYTKSYTEFKRTKEPGFKNERSMTLPELFKTRDSLASREKNSPDRSPGYTPFNRFDKRKLNYEIAKKFSTPFIIILFYFLGVLLGISFYRTHVIIPLLISYFVIFTAWYYLQRLFEKFFKLEEIGSFIGVNGSTIIFGFITLCWFIVLKRFGMFALKEQQSDTLGFVAKNGI